MDKQYKPFAITAKTLGKPKKLYTPLLLVNTRSPRKLSAAFVNAMWDTGAETSIISRELAGRLGFRFDHEIKSRGLTEEARAYYGIAHVALVSNGDIVDTVAAIVDDVVHMEYSFILGMDFISKGTLAISSSNLETTLSFSIPASRHIDFVKEASGTETAVKYLPLSSTKEDDRVYYGHEVIELILPDKYKP